MLPSSFSLLLALYFLPTVFSATASEWRTRSIYQLLTDRFSRPDNSTTHPCSLPAGQYCGGTWRGIIHQLDYIQNMGFTAVWISPVTAQVPNTPAGEAFHGYWQTDLFSLNENFGNAEDLRALAAELHDRNMLLMVDVVVNHFGYPGDEAVVDYSTFTPFSSDSFFHPYCPISAADYADNQTAVENCWLASGPVSLPDVDTSLPGVQSTFNTWIHDLVLNYSVDGLRIDTVKHVPKPFWQPFNDAAGVYCVGEVADGDPQYTCPYTDVLDGVLNYPLYFPLTRAFTNSSGSMSDLASMVQQIKAGCKDTSLLGTFLENHDNPRFPSLTSDDALNRNAIAFAMLADGVPIVYEGQEQGFSGGDDPYNREALWLSGYATTNPLYTFITTLNKMRSHAIGVDVGYLDYMAWPIYTDAHTIAMRKGSEGKQIVAVFSNDGELGADYTFKLGNATGAETGFVVREEVVEILGCGKSRVDESGDLSVAMGMGAPKIFYPAESLNGSGICGY